MECTQRLECTQELYGTQQADISSADQIGFLGICGTKYPVKRGPNKVGRDPQACSITLNMNSISRQHAVVNVLNAKDFMLMDLDSANKTKLMGKALQPYIPHPLRDGDTVQFGDVFGIFRLLEDDNDLPATQAIDIPDTPVFARHASRLKHAPVTTIPESPDVSGDDSFIIPTQPKGDNQFKSPSNKFMKPSAKTISIQPIGTNKIDNIYWNSSKKSTSLNLDDSSRSLNDSAISLKTDNNDIHEMETQPPFPNINNESTDSIYTAETQAPKVHSPSIHSLDTQLPVPLNSNLPFVNKIDNQHDLQFDIYASNKENDNSIYNAETQPFEKDKNALKMNKGSDVGIFETQHPKVENRGKIEDSIFNAETQLCTIEKKDNITAKSTNKSKDAVNTSDAEILGILEADTQPPAIVKLIKFEDTDAQLITAEKKNVTTESTNKSKDTSKDKLNKSDDEILFDDVDGQSFEDEFYSQPLLAPDNLFDKNVDVEMDEDDEIVLSQTDTTDDDEIVAKPGKRVMRLKSDTSNDCDDFDVPTNKLPEKCPNEDDLTDCEEDLFPDETKGDKEVVAAGSPKISFEDMPTQKIEDEIVVLDSPKKPDVAATDNLVKEPNFEEMATQVLPEDVPEDDIQFEDLPTQVLEDDCIVKSYIIDDQQFSEEIISPFKVPLRTPLKSKRKNALKLIDEKPNTKIIAAKPSPSNKVVDDIDDKYYESTQDILEELCSQRESSPEIVKLPQVKTLNNNLDKDTEHIIVIDPNAGNQLSPKKNYVIRDKSSGSSEGDERVSNFYANLSKRQIREVIGVDVQDGKLMRTGSDPSDLEVTPKKVRPFKLMHTELPNSQEIKCNVNVGNGSKSLTTESSSESEVEEDSQDGTPIVFHKKKRTKKNIVKVDLTKKFDTKALPIRVLTRVRKPTSKILDSDEETMKRTKNILKPKFLTEQDDDVDKDIISENITRLKNKNEKKNNKNSNDDNLKLDEDKNRDVNKTDMSAVTDSNKTRKRVHKEKDTKSLDPNTAKDAKTPDTAKTNDTKSPDTSKPKENKAEDTKTPDTAKTKDTKSPEPNKTKDKIPDTAKTKNTVSLDSNKSIEQKTPERNNKDSNTDETKDVKNTHAYKTKDTKKADTNKPDDKMNQQSMIKFLSKPDTKKTKEFEPPSTIATKHSSRRTRKNENSGDKHPKSTNEAKQSKTSEGISNSTIEAMLSTSNTYKTNSSLGLTSGTNRRTRNSRNKANDSKLSPEEEVKRKRGRPRKSEKVEEKTDSAPENVPEIRRSRRQKTSKHNIIVDELEKLKADKIGHASSSTVNVSTSKLNENSAVYNISSGSDVSSPRCLKRCAIADTEEPRAKRSRAVTTSSISLRATPARTGRVQHVLFTAFPYEEVRVKLEKLGAVIVSDVKACTVVVTAQIRRTFKLLCCVGLGRPVAGPAWVQACVDSNTLVDPWLYLIQDDATERRFQFSLRRTLSGARGFLRGYHVSATPAVLPAAPEMKLIVECSGGTWRAQGPQWLCVSCSADRALWPRLRQQGALLVSSELVLSGVLRQRLDLDGNRLDQ